MATPKKAPRRPDTPAGKSGKATGQARPPDAPKRMKDPATGRFASRDGEAKPKPKVLKRRGPRARGMDIDPPPPPKKPAPRTMFAGQPDKSFRFTRERRERLLLLLKSTIPLVRACERIGCSEDTPRDWQRAGHAAIEAKERGEPLDARAEEQAEFAVAFDNALTEAETHMVAMVQRGAANDWRAAAWRLACLRPADYSERWQAQKLKVDSEAAIREAQLAQARAQAQLTEEKLAAVREVRAAGGQVLVVGAEDLVAALVTTQDLPEEVRAAVGAWLNAQGFRLLEARDLGAEPA